MIALINVVQTRNLKERPRDLPMGLIYLGSALKKAGYDVKLYHISHYQIEEVAREIVTLRPLFLGVSVLTGVSTLHNLMISQRVRNLDPNIPIIWGGHHPTAIPEQCIAESCVDYVFMGEGEEGIVQFARAIETNNGFESIPGLVMKIDGRIVRNSPPVLIKDLDMLDFDLDVLDNVSQYVSCSGGSMMFQTSRGCPYRCGFCDIANFYSHSYRKFSIDYVMHYARKYRDMYGVETFHMTDDIFFVNQRDINIMQQLHDLGINIGTIAIRISHLYRHPEIMKVLDELDVTVIFLAWESGVDRILKLMHKDINREIIFHTVRFLAEKYPKIRCVGGGIIGNPTETLEEIQQTVKTAVELRSIHPYSAFFLQLYLPLPGTEFLELAVMQGMARPERAEDWAHHDKEWDKNCQIDWLPWATDKQKQMLVKLDFYSTKVVNSPRGGSLEHMVMSLFYAIARYRYNHLFFLCSEMDMWLFDKLLSLRRVLVKFFTFPL